MWNINTKYPEENISFEIKAVNSLVFTDPQVSRRRNFEHSWKT